MTHVLIQITHRYTQAYMGITQTHIEINICICNGKLYTYRERTQRVTWQPLSRHFSGLGSSFLDLRNATFSLLHFVAICFHDAVSTADVGIGSPSGFTLFAISQNSIDSLLYSNHQNLKILI